MDKIIILHNSLDKHSRDWVSLNRGSYKVIDWYSESDLEKAEYCAKSLPMPTIFPAVVDTEERLIVNNPLSMQEALNSIQVGIGNKLSKELVRLRNRRNQILSATDWIVIPDSPASETCKQNFLTYRTLLRDMNFSSLELAIFPAEPEYEKA